MENFPANSAKAARAQASGERPERVERITSAEPGRRKRGIGRQFKETFVGGSARMAFEYVITDVVVPAIQDTMIEAFQGGIERLIRGEGPRGRRVSTAQPNRGHFDYSGISKAQAAPPRTLSRQARTRQDFSDLIIPARQEAEDVLDRMYELLSKYGSVTVGDLYDMTGVASSHTDLKWGWVELRGAKLRRAGTGGFLLDLPMPQPL